MDFTTLSSTTKEGLKLMSLMMSYLCMLTAMNPSGTWSWTNAGKLFSLSFGPREVGDMTK